MVRYGNTYAFNLKNLASNLIDQLNVHAYIPSSLLILSTILLIDVILLQMVLSIVGPPISCYQPVAPPHPLDIPWTSHLYFSILLLLDACFHFPSTLFITLPFWGTTHQRQCRPRGIVMSSQADLISRPSPYTPIREGMGLGLGSS